MKSTDDVVEFLRDNARDADAGLWPRAVGVFSRAYLRVTLEVIARIASGTFEDPDWLAEFDVRFARLYRDALSDPSTRARCWSLALASRDGDTRLLAPLLLGISAHMRYDLCASLLGGFVEPGAREARRRDFLAVNRVMSQAIDPIQEVLESRYGRWLRAADVVAGGLDEQLTFTGFRGWRDRAWSDAMDILDGRLTLDDVDRRVSRMSRLIALLPA